MMHRWESLDVLHAWLDACAGRCNRHDGWSAHAAVLDRLAANQRVAEAHGWTSCAIERDGRKGRLCAWGIPPGAVERHPIPDWGAELAR